MNNKEAIQMAIMLSKLMPTEKIIEEIKEHSTNFMLTGNEDEKNKLKISCLLFLSGEVPMSANEMIAAMTEHQKISEQIKNAKTQ